MIKSDKNACLKFYLKLLKGDKTVLVSTRKTALRIRAEIDKTSFDNSYLKVTYSPDVYNDGRYTSKTELKQALTDFTEKDLVDYAHSKQW